METIKIVPAGLTVSHTARRPNFVIRFCYANSGDPMEHLDWPLGRSDTLPCGVGYGVGDAPSSRGAVAPPLFAGTRWRCYPPTFPKRTLRRTFAVTSTAVPVR